MELVNTHCHTGYCGHAEGSIQEYVDSAKQVGITTLAFTDHYPLSGSFDPVGYLSVPGSDMPEYIRAVEEAAAANDDMEIILGIELDYLGDTDDRGLTDQDLDRFQLVLGSVHFVDRWPFDDPSQRGKWSEPGEKERIWSRYVDIWCEAAAGMMFE